MSPYQTRNTTKELAELTWRSLLLYSPVHVLVESAQTLACVWIPQLDSGIFAPRCDLNAIKIDTAYLYGRPERRFDDTNAARLVWVRVVVCSNILSLSLSLSLSA